MRRQALEMSPAVLVCIKSLTFILALFLLLYSCSTGHYKAIGKNGDASYYNVSIFHESFSKVLYRAGIDLNKRHFSGLMLIKKLPENNSYRVVFLSEIGLKIFDLEFYFNKKNNFFVHYCLDAFDKRHVINTIKKDIESMFMNYPTEVKKRVSVVDKRENIVINYKLRGINNYYYKTINGDRIFKIERRGLIFKKADITLENYSGPFPDEIFITHKLLKLDIVLTQLNI